ncbi:MAG: winged helix-turn-helix transcriptional regulator [Verrucomicrobiaceae bacterium]|nr:winged helix-turn-helix transcriptional regulator [Verrucomicrobiaceae bacterium]
MQALITFSNALSDLNRLRILSLLRDHKADFVSLRETISISEADLAQHVKILSDAGLLKADKSGKQAKIKHKHAALLEKLFTHFKMSAKKNAQLRADQKSCGTSTIRKTKAGVESWQKAVKKAPQTRKPPRKVTS